MVNGIDFDGLDAPLHLDRAEAFEHNAGATLDGLGSSFVDQDGVLRVIFGQRLQPGGNINGVANDGIKQAV